MESMIDEDKIHEQHDEQVLNNSSDKLSELEARSRMLLQN